MTLASQLPVNVVNCKEILNQGTCLFVKALDNCASEPQLDTIAVDTTAVADGDETASLVSDNADGTLLRAGAVLTFQPSGESITILNDTVVDTTATPVAIEEYTGSGIPADEEHETFGLLELQSPQNIPFNLEATTVDRTDLKSFNTAMVKTNNSFNPQVQVIASKEDKALWQIFEGARSVRDVYAVIYYPSEQIVFGRALISGYNFDASNGEIQRPQFTLEFQGKDYAVSTTYGEADATEQALINEVLSKAGAPQLA